MRRISQILRTFFQAVRWILPWALRATWFLVKFLFNTTMMALASWMVGIPAACRTRATDVGNDAEDNGFPSQFRGALYTVTYLMQGIVIIMCWLIVAHLTVLLVFGLFRIL